MSNTPTSNETDVTERYPVAPHFVAWLNEEPGRAAYFHRIDKQLYPPLISKMKAGLIPISLEFAVRLARAQKPSANPLDPESLMTFVESRQWYRYAIGKDPAPTPVDVTRKPRTHARKALTQAEA